MTVSETSRCLQPAWPLKLAFAGVGMRLPSGTLKLIYLAIHEASKRWTMAIRGWKAALNHFAILFEDRLPGCGKKEAA